MNYDLNKVKQAAKFLDEKNPEWYKVINTETLSMFTTIKCILGQLHGSSYMGRVALGICSEDGWADEHLGAFGYGPNATRDGEKLTKKWIKQINKRLVKE